ncbi:MAG: hypothetical protein HYV63_27560 [Candidatus Schekmanbacteria bacterium]|nr:hypothetical protein [Candidatus Schekmanbacteria bacterium]
MRDLVGVNLGPYRVIQKIGKGGMAEVYKAYQPSLDRDVAIKVLPAHFAHEDGFIERFRAEARCCRGRGRSRGPRSTWRRSQDTGRRITARTSTRKAAPRTGAAMDYRKKLRAALQAGEAARVGKILAAGVSPELRFAA